MLDVYLSDKIEYRERDVYDLYDKYIVSDELLEDQVNISKLPYLIIACLELGYSIEVVSDSINSAHFQIRSIDPEKDYGWFVTGICILDDTRCEVECVEKESGSKTVTFPVNIGRENNG